MTEKKFSSLAAISELTKVRGNCLTYREKVIRSVLLEREIEEGEIDKSCIPYLNRINKIKFIMTTQCCCGHGEKPSKGRRAHIDFRSALSESDTINHILRPFDKKFGIKCKIISPKYASIKISIT